MGCLGAHLTTGAHPPGAWHEGRAHLLQVWKAGKELNQTTQELSVQHDSGHLISVPCSGSSIVFPPGRSAPAHIYCLLSFEYSEQNAFSVTSSKDKPGFR